MTEYDVKTLGNCELDSSLPPVTYTEKINNRVLVDATIESGREHRQDAPSFEIAGPREKIFFNPKKCRIGIVTCGGLCPGLNDVIRAIVMVSWYRYGSREIFGFRYGYAGLVSSGEQALKLTPEIVEDIHQDGGTILGSSRGPQDPCEMVDFLAEKKIDILFTIGGDGTQKGALDISEIISQRNLPVAVIGIPKTIDNDLLFTERTFGFSTAVASSQAAIAGAHMESKAVQNGIGLVKLMGRESGFIAAYASLASSDVNLVLLPEIRFSLAKVMDYLERRLERKSHAVIVVAEGAGQEHFNEGGKDLSGNKKLGDIGLFLRSAIREHFRGIDTPVNVKYIDPSYIIRSVPANADDSVFCFQLAEMSVHAAMSGRTEMVVSNWNGHFVHVPTRLMVRERKKVDTSGLLFMSLLDNTGQPHDLA